MHICKLFHKVSGFLESNETTYESPYIGNTARVIFYLGDNNLFQHMDYQVLLLFANYMEAIMILCCEDWS